MISEFLFHEEEATKEEKSNYVNLKIEIRQMLKNGFTRDVLSEVLLDLRKDVSGEAQKRLMGLYQDLELHKDAFAKLKSWRWEVVSKGILELTQMQVAESYGFVTKFINDKRSAIRKQAEIATVTLRNEGVNYFLDTTKYRISEWQQLKLLDVLRNQKDFEPPKFKAWLTSNNKHVVLFALRLIKYYNQNDAKAALIELVKHKDNQIKEEAIACIKEFNVVKGLDTLKQVFWKSTVDVKIAILGAIGSLGNESDIEFLNLIENKESNFAVKSKAISSINTIAPGSIMPKKGIIKITGNQIPEDIVKVASEGDEREMEEIGMDESNSEQKTSERLEAGNEATEEIPMNVEMEANAEALDVPAQKDELATIDLDFLPLVVGSVEEEHAPATRSDADKLPDTETTNEIGELEVSFDAISAIPPETADMSGLENSGAGHGPMVELDDDEIAFLPVVVTNANDSDSVPAEHVVEDDTHKTAATIDCENNEVETTEYLTGEIGESIQPDFDMAQASDEVVTPEIDEIFENYIEWPLKEGEDSVIEEPSFELLETDESLEVTENDISAEIEELLKSLPEPKYYDGETLITMRLLDDIEELGDHREIPLLKEFLAHSDKACVKDRAKEILEIFEADGMQQNSHAIIGSNTQEIKPFSVFEDLFRSCDTEAKLILMDEIIDIGDEKEIEFLKTLLEDPELSIREKAEPILEGLQKKLFQNSLAFEPEATFADDEMDDIVISKAQRSVLEQLISFPNKIIEKLNG